MLIFSRLIPILTTLLAWLWFYLLSIVPEYWYVWLIAQIIISGLLMLKLFSWQYKKKEFIAFLITISFLIGGSFLFLFIVDSAVIRIIATIIISLFIGYYYNNIFQFIYLPKAYQPYSLENISGYLNLLALFLFFTGFF